MMEQEAFAKLTPEEQKEILNKRIPSKKVRCKNWPNCKDPSCIFAHPTETVISFYNFLFFFSVHISLLACMEISVVIFIQVFLVNTGIFALELDAHILILQDLILEWECIQT